MLGIDVPATEVSASSLPPAERNGQNGEREHKVDSTRRVGMATTTFSCLKSAKDFPFKNAARRAGIENSWKNDEKARSA